MVGGHGPSALNENVYSLQFSERPAALLKFLMSLGSQWNISLFHYRNHGAAFGKVLIGLQIAEAECVAFEHGLDALGLVYRRETDNPAYRLFAGGVANK
jgi:threonine dehydratase